MSEWLIVLNADGAVFAAHGGAPAKWEGTRLDSHSDLPAAIGRAADEAQRLAALSATGSAFVSADWPVPASPVRILASDKILGCSSGRDARRMRRDSR